MTYSGTEWAEKSRTTLSLTSGGKVSSSFLMFSTNVLISRGWVGHLQ